RVRGVAGSREDLLAVDRQGEAAVRRIGGEDVGVVDARIEGLGQNGRAGWPRTVLDGAVDEAAADADEILRAVDLGAEAEREMTKGADGWIREIPLQDLRGHPSRHRDAELAAADDASHRVARARRAVAARRVLMKRRAVDREHRAFS